MVDIPFWDGKGPYPSVKLRIDFRRDLVGDFVYHCHILEHEDNGMMAIIRMLPANSNSSSETANNRLAAAAPNRVWCRAPSGVSR